MSAWAKQPGGDDGGEHPGGEVPECDRGRHERPQRAGGAGPDGALSDAATIGHGQAFTQLRRALDAARHTRVPPATTLARLGAEIDSRDLAELAASRSLAGTEGARVRASLTARADSLRTHLLTDTDAAAKAATERLGLPWGLLFLGCLVFLGYPALHQILTGL